MERVEKRTAVEWLANRIIELEERLRLKEINLNDFIEEKDLLVEQALEMEKDQIMDAYKHELDDSLGTKILAEEYYNKTFKSE